MRGKVQLLPVHHDKVGITPACAGKRLRCTSVQTFRWDHPRMCGEKLIPCGQCIGCRGSPPRMRGKGPAAAVMRITGGIAPAHAGKSARQGSGLYLILGSPPHMRGKVDGFGLTLIFLGITPAHAGKSTLSHRKSFCAKDHPRTCGEKLQIPEYIGGQRRITPAHAGKRFCILM